MTFLDCIFLFILVGWWYQFRDGDTPHFIVATIFLIGISVAQYLETYP